MPDGERMIEPDEDLQREKLERFRKEYIVSKSKLLRKIHQTITRTAGQIDRTPAENIEKYQYLMAKRENLQAFETLVDNSPLFDSLYDWWCYEFTIGSTGTALYLRHVAFAEMEGVDNEADYETGWLSNLNYDARYKLLECKCKYLSSEEFAKERGAAMNTVRVWIRRGKIRSAMKLGNAWMIPKLTAPFKRGFMQARYEWSVYLSGVPTEFAGISEPGEIIIRQTSDKGKFVAWYYTRDEAGKREYFLDTGGVERLELYLIAQPAVEYVGDLEIVNQ